MDKTCGTCRWLAECIRDHGAHPTDPICTAYVSFATKPQPKEPPHAG